MRSWLALVLTLVALLVILGGCVNRSRGPVFGRPTGTCAGACEHYFWCKAQYGEQVEERSQQVCELECAEVFSGAESLAAFESLSCDDTVAFVEGESGRGPGVLLTDAPPTSAGEDRAPARPRDAEPPSSERSSHAPGPEAP